MPDTAVLEPVEEEVGEVVVEGTALEELVPAGITRDGIGAAELGEAEAALADCDE